MNLNPLVLQAGFFVPGVSCDEEIGLDLDTFIALLMLLVVVGGGLLSRIWSRMNHLTQQISDERVRLSEKYITSHEMERRLEQAVAPIERMLARIEKQNNEIFNKIIGSNRCSEPAQRKY